MNKLIIDLTQVKSPTGKIEVDLKTGDITPYMPTVSLEELSEGDFVHFSYYCEQFKKEVAWVAIIAKPDKETPTDILNYANIMLSTNRVAEKTGRLKFYVWQNIENLTARMATLAETQQLKVSLDAHGVFWNSNLNKIEPYR